MGQNQRRKVRRIKQKVKFPILELTEATSTTKTTIPERDSVAESGKKCGKFESTIINEITSVK